MQPLKFTTGKSKSELKEKTIIIIYVISYYNFTIIT